MDRALIRAGRALRILVVEAASATPSMAEMVAALGGETMEAAASEAAVALVERRRPDVVLIDADAVGAAETLRMGMRERYRIPVVFVTARQDAPALHDLFQMSSHVLFRPVVPSRLGPVVRRACEGLNRS